MPDTCFTWNIGQSEGPASRRPRLPAGFPQLAQRRRCPIHVPAEAGYGHGVGPTTAGLWQSGPAANAHGTSPPTPGRSQRAAKRTTPKVRFHVATPVGSVDVPTPDFIVELRAKVGTDLPWLTGVTAVVLRDGRPGTGGESWSSARTTAGRTPVTGIVDPAAAAGSDARRCGGRSRRASRANQPASMFSPIGRDAEYRSTQRPRKSEILIPRAITVLVGHRRLHMTQLTRSASATTSASSTTSRTAHRRLFPEGR